MAFISCDMQEILLIIFFSLLVRFHFCRVLLGLAWFALDVNDSTNENSSKENKSQKESNGE